MTDEEWKIIKGFPMYMISTHGRIRSTHKSKDIVLKLIDHYKGYKIAFLYGSEFKNKKFFVHRLVADHFIENPDDKPFVNHIDCNKQNNFLSNLEWMTEAENTQWYHKNKNNVPLDEHPF